MTRRFARELALQALFSIEVGRHDPAAVLADVGSGRDGEEHRAFIKDLVLGTLEHREDSDASIVPLLQGWTIDRLPTIDRLLLRMALFEMRYRPETPHAVVMNEAIELAKKFSTEESGRFVNGVLSGALKSA
jgi:N utilization substance protein B